MIQRIQSLWLLVAALLAGSLFIPAITMYHANVQNAEVVIKASNDYLQLLLALVMTLLPFAAIFFFKNRKRQLNLIMLTLVLTIGFIAYMVILVTNLNNQVPKPTQGTYSIGAILPVLSFVALFLARGGIKKDEKLVKSLDRLR